MSKSLALIALRAVKQEDISRGWLTAHQLVVFTGLSPAAVYSLMTRLVRWFYVYRRGVGYTREGHRIIRSYHIAKKGERFINLIPGLVIHEIIPFLQERWDNNNYRLGT